MTLSPTYLRARSAEQKEERRRNLLNTAKTMLDQSPNLRDLGINELARQAQMTKSNVYRYFESSEAVLMDVLVEEFMQWHGDLAAALGAQAGATVNDIARAFSATAAARPLLCRLASILPSILEHNVSLERMVEFKRKLLGVQQQAAQGFHTCVPTIAVPVFEQFIHQALPLIIGLWPLSNPAEVAQEVLEHPDLAGLRYDFQRDLETGLLMLLQGLTAVNHDRS